METLFKARRNTSCITEDLEKISKHVENILILPGTRVVEHVKKGYIKKMVSFMQDNYLSELELAHGARIISVISTSDVDGIDGYKFNGTAYKVPQE
ncbi:MAG: hypothetical protein V1818_01750 [Candidatus Aenigmatarchaeota archaeon]